MKHGRAKWKLLFFVGTEMARKQNKINEPEYKSIVFHNKLIHI